MAGACIMSLNFGAEMSTTARILAAVLLAAALCHAQQTAIAVPQSSAAARSPNIVFILADDLGYADVGCYGQKKIRTPAIDALAREGIRFTQAYCGTSVCAPSRCSLMTGLHIGHAHVRGNRLIKPEGQEPLPPDAFTVA